MTAVLKRELKAYFYSPIGYVCVGMMMLLYGFYFYQVMLLGSSSNIASVYGAMFIWGMMFIPIITMRSFSEETKNKTDQALLTAPVGVTSIVIGKFLAGFIVYAIATVGSLVPAIIIGIFSSPSWPLIFGNFLGTLLYGAAMVSIGVFLSSLTQSQVVAAVATYGVTIFLLMVDQFSSNISNAVVQKIIQWISFNSRYTPFTKGMLDVSSMVFFLSVIAVFVFLTARKLESRRWS